MNKVRGALTEAQRQTLENGGRCSPAAQLRRTKMDRIEPLLFVAALMLFFVVSLAALSAFSKMLAQKAKTDGARRSWEGGCLILLACLLMLLILIWRAW
jgi:protein-S-isoprenylcysteine O-methyltransferase Ste14